MDVNKINQLAAGNPDRTEVIAFRLATEKKQQLLELCQRDNLSVGRLLRALVDEYIEEVA